MGPQQIWSKVNDRFAHILVLRDQDLYLLKVSGMSLFLKGKVKKVLEALEEGQHPVESGGKLVSSLNAREISKAEVSPGDVSLKLHGEGDRPTTLSFTSEGATAGDILQSILAQSSRRFETCQEQIGVIEALMTPGITGIFAGLLWMALNHSAGKLASGKELVVRGRHQGFQHLMNWAAGRLGTTGTRSLDLTLLVLFVGWAASRLINPPERTVWKPQGA